MTDFILPDDHIETPILRRYAPGARCLVIAGYKGATVRYLLDHGAAHVLVAEPQLWACNALRDNLNKPEYDGRWELVEQAIVPWETEGDSFVIMSGWGTDGAYVSKSNNPNLAMVSALGVAQWLRNDDFDFCVLNCEGAEYWLLPYLMDKCDHVLVQFHAQKAAPMPADMFLGLPAREFIGKGWYLYA